jgi:hypothetical protein
MNMMANDAIVEVTTDVAMTELLERIVADYTSFTANSPYGDAVRKEEYNNAFRNGLRVEEGRKYLKVIKRTGTQDMVWGFIVNTDDDKKFKRGDILMAAGYNAPARNKSRGNIYDGNYVIRWTGPLYIK